MTSAVLPASPALRQFLRFGIVGVANTLTSYLVVLGLTQGAGVSVALASALGYAAGTMQSFVINRRWTFAIRDQQGLVRQALGFLVVNVLCAAVFAAIVSATSPGLGLAIATVIAVAATLPINFGLNRWLVFRAT